MTTLWKRASGPQQKMLRMITGAVLNTANAHPGKLPDEKFARGVAKRAVGTISAQWAELLAGDGGYDTLSSERRNISVIRRSRRHTLGGDAERVRVNDGPFTKECQRLGRKISPLRAAGDLEAAECLRAAIQALAPLARRERGKGAL